MSPPPRPPPKVDARQPKQAVKPMEKQAASPKPEDVNQTELVKSSNELQNAIRRKSAELLVKKVTGVISEDIGNSKYELPEGEKLDSLGTRLGLELERGVHLNYSNAPGDPSATYRQRVRTIVFNLGKNHALCEGLVRNTLTPDALSKMSTEEMASEELQRRDAAMKEEAEKQHILIKEEGPRIRRTHKGEEIVGGDMERSDGNNESIFTVPPPRRRESLPVPEMSPTTPMSRTFSEIQSPAPNNGAGSPSDVPPHHIKTQGLSGGDEAEKKSSSSFNIHDVWSSVQSPDDQKPRQLASPGLQRLAYDETSPVVAGNQQVKADPEIDELLRNEEAESPPYSPTEHPSDPSMVWRGKMSMSGLAEFLGPPSMSVELILVQRCRGRG